MLADAVNLDLWLLDIAPFIVELITFMFLYIVLPNIKVRWYDGLLGAFIAAILFEIAKKCICILSWLCSNLYRYLRDVSRCTYFLNLGLFVLGDYFTGC